MSARGRSVNRRTPLLLVVVGVLTILLPLMAYLQYDWLGKVSEREREQMQAGLSRTLGQFRADFDREITRLYLQFQAQPASNPSAADYAKLYTHWSSTAPYPRLIKDIFFSDSETLQRLNVASGVWEASDWTVEFGPRRPFAPMDGSIPAVMVPILDLAPLSAGPQFFVKTSISHLIVRLNLHYIQSEFIPFLVRSHFGGSATDYRVRITDREDSSRVIYRSDDDVTGSDAGDASEGLLALRAPEFRTLIPAALAPEGGFVGGARVEKFDLRVFRGTAGEKVANFGFATDSGVWRVSASHRSGSLDAAVEQVRRRNLAVSFGILSLLAASVAIVLISAARAQRLARQQMEFVSTVSHELRTPLAVICSAGENLADGVVRDAYQLKSYGKVVHNEGRRLTEMVEQILSFAGIQSGLKKHALVPTDVPAVVDQALDALEIPIREGCFVVERRNAEPTLPVMADPVALRRAIQNLVSNVIKYAGANKWLGISVERDEHFVKIAVQDRGIGISASDLPHIFEPFYRGRSAVEGQIQGSGLGLSLVREIVHAHGGRIDVTSNLGEGSTFTIMLPEVSS